MSYNRRIVDDELDGLFAGLPALSLEGPKAVGKTSTARQRAKAEFWLDDAAQRELVAAERHVDVRHVRVGEDLLQEQAALPVGACGRQVATGVAGVGLARSAEGVVDGPVEELWNDRDPFAGQ